ncbi:hypothetical protein Tco_0808403 [Tanacetum coccineum]
MEDRDMTMQEYVQYETKKALRNGKVYNWETATYSKIKCVEDINDLRFFEKKFPAIVYDDALSFDSGFSSKHTVSSRHVNEINLKNETSLSKNNEEEYNVISYNDLFRFNIISANDSKLDTDNDDDRIGHWDRSSLPGARSLEKGLVGIKRCMGPGHAGIQTLLQHTFLLIYNTWRIIHRKKIRRIRALTSQDIHDEEKLYAVSRRPIRRIH